VNRIDAPDTPTQVPARERLLDAAEEMFADLGFNGTSVRQIVERAEVNLGALPYYFGTKENLFKQVLLRRAEPLRNERRRLIEALQGREAPPTLEEVIWALVEPAFRTSRENDAFRRLLGRASMDPAPEVRRLMREIYTMDFMTVPATLRAQFADLGEEEFFWKLNCFYGVMLFVQADTGKIQTIAGDGFDTSQPAVALKYVVPFLAAGLRSKVNDPPH
jgi:AcrR family transcriptional regulator